DCDRAFRSDDCHRIHDAGGAEGGRSYPEPLGALAGGAVRYLAAAGRWIKVHLQGRPHTSLRLQAFIPASAHPGVDGCVDLDRGDPDWSLGDDWVGTYALADRRREHWIAGDPGADGHRRLWSRAGGMVVEQQVFDAGSLTGVGADGQL